MLKRRIWLMMGMMIMLFFLANTRIEALNGSCQLKQSSIPQVISDTIKASDIINNCYSGYEPYLDDSGVLIICSCTPSGQIKDKSHTPFSRISDEGSSYNPICYTTNGDLGTNSALGCIPTEIKSFVPWLLNILFGVAGGIAFLLMVYGFILIATSSGDEKKVAGARETITSAIVGLLVCIFSIFILKLIAVNILQIPGF